MLAAAAVLLGVARRWRLPYPVLLALTGAAVAIAPITSAWIRPCARADTVRGPRVARRGL